MTKTIIVAIFIILLINLFVSVFFEWLNIKKSRKDIPEILADIYDKETYAKQMSYQKEHSKISILETVIGSFMLITFFSIGGFGFIHKAVSSITHISIFQTLLFFGILGFFSLLFSFPFSYYSKFVIEQKYGFNNMTIKLFLLDILKSIVLSIIIGGLVLALITFIFNNYQNIFWIATLAIIFILSLIMNALYSTVILPIFNKKEPLREGSLRQKVIQLSSTTGFSINNIYIIDGSKRSSKANAFFTGFGKKKSIFLYDTLLNKLIDDEIVAVLAHELGHYKMHHIWINLVIGITQSAIFLYLFNIISINPVYTQAMGFDSQVPIFHLSVLCFAMLIEPIQLIIGIITNKISRKMEHQADIFAKRNGMGELLIVALKKLTSMNYSDLTPHPYYVALHYSHPTLLNRIKSIREHS